MTTPAKPLHNRTNPENDAGSELYQPVSSAARQAYIDGYPEAELREIDAENGVES